MTIMPLKYFLWPCKTSINTKLFKFKQYFINTRFTKVCQISGRSDNRKLKFDHNFLIEKTYICTNVTSKFKLLKSSQYVLNRKSIDLNSKLIYNLSFCWKKALWLIFYDTHFRRWAITKAQEDQFENFKVSTVSRKSLNLFQRAIFLIKKSFKMPL